MSPAHGPGPEVRAARAAEAKAREEREKDPALMAAYQEQKRKEEEARLKRKEREEKERARINGRPATPARLYPMVPPPEAEAGTGYSSASTAGWNREGISFPRSFCSYYSSHRCITCCQHIMTLRISISILIRMASFHGGWDSCGPGLYSDTRPMQSHPNVWPILT